MFVVMLFRIKPHIDDDEDGENILNGIFHLYATHDTLNGYAMDDWE